MELSLGGLRSLINSQLATKDPFQIVSLTATTVLCGVYLWNVLHQPESVITRVKGTIFRLARRVPFVARQVEEALTKLQTDLERDLSERTENCPYVTELPEGRQSPEEVLTLVEKYLSLGKVRWRDGYVSGAVYFQEEDLIQLLTKVYGMASYTNPLHPDIFPGVCKMEAEVVRIAANLFHGSKDACGTMTTGGTESIFMACKAYRDYGYWEKGITNPEIILPRTAHPAFEKSAMYLGVHLKYIEVDPLTLTVPLKKVKSAIGRNTILLVGSVPNFPYGTMDDIQGIAALGKRYKIPVHVDCCLGGFLTAFMPQAGYPVPAFDFAVNGVTSISADTHKYAFAPKGSSVILYSKPVYRHYQYCVTTDWPGGVYGSPTVSGSRAGGVIAACWASMMYFGLEGYVEATKQIIRTSRYIENELRKMPGIYVFGKPATSVIAVGSKSFDIFRLVEELSSKGWSLNALQFPSGFHICVTHMHTRDGVADRFLSDMKQAVEFVMKKPQEKADGKMAIYGQAQSIPDRSIVGDYIKVFLDSLYFTPKDQKVVMNGNTKTH